MTITYADRSVYREARRKGCTALGAYDHVTVNRAARECLAESGTGGYYTVDTDALRKHAPDLDFPDGMTASVQLLRDEDTGMDDAECYSAEDVQAWSRDAWWFCGVEVCVTFPDGRAVESCLWGVEVGPYWIGSTEGQTWHAVTDGLFEAIADADTSRVPVPVPEDAVIRVLREIASDLRRDGDTQAAEKVDRAIAERMGQ